MTQYRSAFIRDAVDRGFIHQCTDLEALDALCAAGPVTAYIGFDCTAPSLHAGSLVPIMLLRLFQAHGHKPIPLMGGGTTRVGDPSGKDESRKLLTDQDIEANLHGIRKVFDHFLTFGEGPTDAEMVNNADWLDGLEYIPFLRDIGRHFSVNRMLTFESVKMRLEREQPLSFLEFNYMLLQAYDFLELSRRFDVRLQMGGSDQWGNIVAGVELARRVDQVQVYGLTTPLLTTASGAKMGKTAAGAIWLDGERLSPYQYWQFWRNTDDLDVGPFLRLFTELPLARIAEMEAAEGAGINEAKVALANAATALLHGEEAAAAAAETARRTFAEGEAGEDLPTVTVDRAELTAGVAAFELFQRAGLAASKGEARKLIRGGGAKLNNATITDEGRVIGAGDLDAGGTLKLSAGKKRHALVKTI